MMNGNGNGHPGPGVQNTVYDGKTEVAVTLPVDTWKAVLTVVADAPWKIADPLMNEIRRQITATLEPKPGSLDGSGSVRMTEVQNFPRRLADRLSAASGMGPPYRGLRRRLMPSTRPGRPTGTAYARRSFPTTSPPTTTPAC